MNNKRLITNGPLFDGFNLYDQGSVLIEGQKIAGVFNGAVCIDDATDIDAQGDLIMPGLVDLHSDSLERSIEKRKGVFFDIDFALLNLDRQLAACGITTFCHAISFADDELGLRSPKEARNCVQKIKNFNKSEQSLVKHNTHIRYEVGSQKSFHIIKELLNQGMIDIMSVMDHTPGQGQFRSMESYIKFHTTEYYLSQHEILEKAAEKQAENQKSWQMVTELINMVNAAGIPILSHDDDTRQKIDLIKKLGISASEFPVTLEAATLAYKSGMDIFMGAPNLIRNQSTNGNLKASDVLKHGFCTGLVSDYYPESLFQAAFIASNFTTSREKALQTVTSGPGSFLKPTKNVGVLEKGSDADIIIVNQDHSWAHITRSFVRGKSIFQIQ
ncbi:alpha-D-ribose 1-methylphosphonate 5-triphosphate diphosphatase [Desulfobacula toluolica]|uniref:PhnM: phopsphonate metabolism protein, predicted C-P lyase subunit n=1 Tax=Desulfobacula toluolica (strain DSM 7467 / Tol2) TaxID=651182 RepID=K0NMW3_DESTT|nr:alpha-D-ribose 1-methylphosphonate 5-triphosphate diphosphatase [Desulfobacula toluolica]CCK81353.1 PhnM: phopsphonate metabolism protein, predicted C-P lyase subunit [Desulfobacula toluolica Tol2]